LISLMITGRGLAGKNLSSFQNNKGWMTGQNSAQPNLLMKRSIGLNFFLQHG
jgi:hypothetical protein